jgi:hypothetical protein
MRVSVDSRVFVDGRSGVGSGPAVDVMAISVDMMVR